MSNFILRTLQQDQWPAVAELICYSIRDYFAAVGKRGRFPNGPESTLLFPEVYEAMDPGCCLVVEDTSNHRLAGSCFYHPRSHHISIGIMNVHPDYFGRGVARLLMQRICQIADESSKPIRLVSSAMNIDSFSLYTRAGFVPRDLFQIMTIKVDEKGLNADHPDLSRVRPATVNDVPAMAKLEWEVSGIKRESDYLYFLRNSAGIWKVFVIDQPGGTGIDGFVVSIKHPASVMIGPGVMRNESAAAALILYALNDMKGASPACLVPAAKYNLVKQLYAWGLRNTELAVFQCRGHAAPFNGVNIPTFMPETG